MKRKVIAIVTILLITVIVGTLVFLYIQPVPVKWNAKVILTGNQATLYLNYDNEGTLCKAVTKIEYISTNGSWVNIPSKTVSTDEGSTFYLNDFKPSDDMNFKYFGQDMTFIEFSDSLHFKNLKITCIRL